MTRTQLILRSLRFYWRTNLGVVAGVAIATAVMVGALVVGDSVRYSLLRMALNRLGDVHLAVSTGDRLFTQELARRISEDARLTTETRDAGMIRVAPVLQLSGVASADGGQRQANGVQIIGVNEQFWAPLTKTPPPDSEEGLIINERLAAQLGVNAGDQVLLRVAKPSALPRDVPLASEVDQSVRLALTVGRILPDDSIGRFSLQADQIPPFNAFVPLERLQEAVEAQPRINMMLVRTSGDGEALLQRVAGVLADHWTPADVQLEVRRVPDRPMVELRSSRVFLDPPAVEAAFAADENWTRLLTYFVNELASDGKATPYSMATAMDAAALPAGMTDDQIVVTQWLADDLDLQTGDPVTLKYWIVGEGRQLIEQEAAFTVHSIVPTSGTGAIGDRAMMPDFPGIADAEDSRNWEPGIPINLDLIRDKDEAYWDEYRGTPKAFVTLNWAQQHWGNRFGGLTALRLPAPAGVEPDQIAAKIRDELDPASAGLFFRGVRAEAIAASQQGTDFGGLFIGLSMFLVIAALLLTALLFVFGVEQRAAETGTLLAVGYTPKQVRRLWLIEGGVLAMIGAMLGLALGVGYTHGVLWALENIWADAVINSSLVYHATWTSLLIGAAAGVLTALAAMWWVLRRQARQPARVLLAARFGGEESPAPGNRRRWALWLGVVCIVGALGLLGTLIAKPSAAGGAGAGGFFGAGSLLLIGGLFLSAALLGRGRAARQSAHFTTAALAWRNSTRRRGRSLATITMLACGTFLIVSINAFRHAPGSELPKRESGTGGFALYAETALPVYHDLNAAEGREAFGLDEQVMADVSIVQMRLKPGDEASCLNLNAPRQPTLLGVDPEELNDRDPITDKNQSAFVFVNTIEDSNDPWLLLSRADDEPDAPVPAIVDQSVAQWILKKGLGDTIQYLDERGRPFDVQIVGTLGNSVLQGSLIISDEQFVRRFPGAGGYRVMLVDAPWQRMDEVKQELERALSDVGIVAMPTPERLALFSAVENTYLTIFGVLGGLGLVLGCIGLALVVLRNVLERRSELALMRSVGFTPGKLRWLVVSEHWTLVVLGLLLGVVAAALAIVPALQHETDLPVTTLAVTLIAIGVSALAWTALAAGVAVRGRLVEALRNE